MIETVLAMNPSTLIAFITAGILLNLTPGADVMFTAATALRSGPIAGTAAAAGIAVGSLGHVVLTAAGVAAILAANPTAFAVLKYAGAAYLAYLALRTWNASSAKETSGAGSLKSAFLKGALTNLLNPKVALFILAFLPAFTDPKIGPVWQQIIILGLIFGITGFVITALYGMIAGKLRGVISGRETALNKISAGVYGLLALRLATQ